MPVLVWFVVAAMPWWSVARPDGGRTVHGSAAVWSASTAATCALGLAAVVSVLALRRRRAGRRERELLAAVSWVPVLLLVWELVTILRRSPAAPGSVAAQFEAAVARQAPQFAHPYGTVYRDHLMVLTRNGAHQGFGVAALLGTILVVGQAVLLTAWARRSRVPAEEVVGAGGTLRRWAPAVTVAVLWVVVAALPWWSQDIGVSDADGTRTEHRHAAVWTASTLATVAVLIALVVSVMILRPGDRPAGRRVFTAFTVFAWASFGLLLWQVAEVVIASAPTVPMGITIIGPSTPEEPPWLVRDQLERLSLDGLHEGYGYGAWLGAALVLLQAVLLTVRLTGRVRPA